MKVTQPNHALFWWLSKLLCGFALITFVVLRFVAGAEPDWHSEIIVGQLFVVVFGVINLWHYYLLKCANTDIGKPTVLVSRGGLFRVIRHPMYFADIFIYFGLFLLCMAAKLFVGFIIGRSRNFQTSSGRRQGIGDPVCRRVCRVASSE